MVRGLGTYFSFLCAAAMAGAGLARGLAQQVSVGQQAVSVVLKHYALNPLAFDPKTGKPLPGDGVWSVIKTPPATCPQTEAPCVEVFYEVPAESVRCSWTVLLNPDGADGSFLDENDDAEHYLLREVSGGEAAAQVDTRKRPIYSPIAILAHVGGVVVINVLVGKSGDVQNAYCLSGPSMLMGASVDAASHWTFKPLTVGTRAVPYTIRIEFTYHTTGPGDAKVEKMTP
jgi:hypothetical protein